MVIPKSVEIDSPGYIANVEAKMREEMPSLVDIWYQQRKMVDRMDSKKSPLTIRLCHIASYRPALELGNDRIAKNDQFVRGNGTYIADEPTRPHCYRFLAPPTDLVRVGRS